MGEGFVPAAPVAPPPEPAAEPSEPVDDNGHDERWWQQQVVSWANRKAQAQDELAQLEAQKRILTYGRNTERARYRQQVDETEKRLAEARRMLDEELPKEARMAGAPRNWLTLPGLEKSDAAKGGKPR